MFAPTATNCLLRGLELLDVCATLRQIGSSASIHRAPCERPTSSTTPRSARVLRSRWRDRRWSASNPLGLGSRQPALRQPRLHRYPASIGWRLWIPSRTLAGTTQRESPPSNTVALHYGPVPSSITSHEPSDCCRAVTKRLVPDLATTKLAVHSSTISGPLISFTRVSQPA
jgi:hypothetical protein